MASAGCRSGVLEPPNEFAGRWTPEQRHMRKPVDHGFRSRTPEPMLYTKFNDYEGMPEVSTTTSPQATTAACAPPIPPKPAHYKMTSSSDFILKPSISVQNRRAGHRPLPPKSPMTSPDAYSGGRTLPEKSPFSSPDAYSTRRPLPEKSPLSSPDAYSRRRPLPEKSPVSSPSTYSNRRPLPSKSPLSSPDAYSTRRPLPEKSPMSSPDAYSNRQPMSTKSPVKAPPLPPKKNGVSFSPMNTTCNGREISQSYTSLPDGEVLNAEPKRKLKLPGLFRKGYSDDKDFQFADWEAKEESGGKRHHNRGFSK
nr:unnamed protein product [Spirometra erinaceieuropaei]